MTESEKHKIFCESMEKYNFLTPILAFDDTFMLSTETRIPYFDPSIDLLSLNAKEENGKNLYLEFVRNTLTKNMDIEKRLFTVNDVYPSIYSTLKKDGKGRALVYNLYKTCISFLVIFKEYEAIMNVPSTEDEMIEYTRNVLRGLRKEIGDYLNNNAPANEVIARLISNAGNNSKQHLKMIYETISEYLTVLKFLKQDKEKNPEINVEEFKKSFDIDKLYLLIGKSIVEYEKSAVTIINKTSPAFGQLLHYIESINSAGLLNYNPKIKYYNNKTKKIENYSLQDLGREIKELMPYFNKEDYTYVTYEDIEKMGLDDNNNVLKLNRLINSEMVADIAVNWKLIPKGKKPVTNNPLEEKENKPKTNNSTNTRLREGEVYYRLLTLQDTDYTLEMVGEEKFAGYIGFIYANGLVVFEKLFDDAERTIPSRIGNATYIMTIENFAKFTKMDKNELIAYMKRTDSEEIKRVCHNKNWKNKLTNIIAGIDYTAETKAMVDALIQKYQDLNKKEG